MFARWWRLCGPFKRRSLFVDGAEDKEAKQRKGCKTPERSCGTEVHSWVGEEQDCKK